MQESRTNRSCIVEEVKTIAVKLGISRARLSNKMMKKITETLEGREFDKIRRFEAKRM